MKRTYIWEHYLKGQKLGEIRRIFSRDGKSDIPFYDRDERGKLIAGASSLPTPWPLMGLDSITNVNLPVIVPEGQKARQAWQGLGYQAVSSLFGSNSAAHTDWAALKGCKKIYLAPDNDPQGEGFAQDVYSILRRQGANEIFLITLPSLPPGGDVCDLLKTYPELKEWNELDPIEDDPHIDEIVKKFEEALKAAVGPCPNYWTVQADWLEPERLESKLEPILRMDSSNADHLLPTALAPWIQDVAYRLDVPMEYVAIGAIVMAGQAIGSACGIRPKRQDDWTIYPNLWGIVCGPPGTLKSPALSESIYPLVRQDDAQFAAYEEAQKEHEKAKLLYEAKTSNLKGELKKAGSKSIGGTGISETDAVVDQFEAPPPEPVCKRFLANDVTVEAMCKILNDNPRGVLLYRDELYGLLRTWDKEKHETDRPFFLEAWDGAGRRNVDRATKPTLRVKNMCVSILGGMQPETLRRYLVEAADDLNDGLLQRFQLAVMFDESEITVNKPVDQLPDRAARHRAFEVIEKIVKAEFHYYGAEVDPDTEKPFYRFEDDAQELFFSWYQELSRKMKEEENPFIAQHLSKFRKLMPALALIFHVLDMCDESRAHSRVSVWSIEKAIAWVRLLETHARRIYKLIKPVELSKAGLLGEHIRAGKLPQRFTAREIQKKGWRGIKEMPDIKKACDELVAMNWLRADRKPPGKTGGRPKEEFIINPKLGIAVNG